MPARLGLKGLIPSSPGQLTAGSRLVLATSDTFPALAERLMVPMASGCGKGPPTDPPEPSWTRKYCPGATVPLTISVLLLEKAPVAEAYCTEYGVTEKSTVAAPRLKISMKS